MEYSDQVVFDGFNFGDNGLVLTNIDHLTLAPRDNQLERLANRNGAVLVQSMLGTKPIILEGYYIGASRADAQDMYDTLAAALNRQERSLVVPHGSGTRTYVATPENVIIKQPEGLNRLTFSIEFVVPSGKAAEPTTTELFDTTITDPASTVDFTVLGSAQTRPLITLSYTSVTGGTGQTISILNARDFIGITITGDFVTGDTVTIDSENFQIYHNETLIAPTGRMPIWASGPGQLYYSDTFTNRSVDITAEYTQHNL